MRYNCRSFSRSFIAELRNRRHIVKPTDNEILDGIRVVYALFETGKIGVHEQCIGLITELRSYVWDEKAAERGEEKPVKQLDHGPDALRYYIMTKLPAWRRECICQNAGITVVYELIQSKRMSQ